MSATENTGSCTAENPRSAAGVLRGAMWEQAIPVTLTVPATENIEDEDFCHVLLFKDVILPFIPRVGDTLGVGAEGDFLEVDSVFWSEHEGISVWFKMVKGAVGRMLTDGWKKEFAL